MPTYPWHGIWARCQLRRPVLFVSYYQDLAMDMARTFFRSPSAQVVTEPQQRQHQEQQPKGILGPWVKTDLKPIYASKANLPRD